MVCPKYERCGLRDTLTSDAFLEGTFKGEKLHLMDYGAIDRTVRLLTERLCESEDGFRQCEGYKQGLLSSQWPAEEKTGNPFRSYEEMNAYEIMKANSSEDKEEGEQ